MQRTRQKSFKLALNISYRFLIDPTIIQNYLALMDSCRFPFCWWKALPQPFAHCPAYLVQEAQLPKEWMILLCSSHSDRKVSLSMKSMNYYSDLIQQDAPQTEVILIIQPHLIIIVMLSQLLKERKAHYDSLRMHISLSYLDQQLEIDELAPHYQQAKILSLTHCHLTSLEGLEQFTQLEELNLRSNKITEASELLRITNKQLITRLQFTGNDIEYLGAGMFFNLVQYFPNLVELNGKNYLSVLHKNPKKKHDMKRIVAQSYKLQKQMTKTVTRYKIHHPHDQATPSRTHKIDTNYQNQTESLSKNQDLQYTSKKQRSSIQYSPKPQQDKENYHNGSNHLQNDVSLGDISNIPLTKSVRGSYLSNTSNIKTANQNKKKGLEIVTLNESLQNNKVALSQPTATFAMQREKENQQSSFAFKNKEKKYLPTNLPIEENAMESKYDFERPTKRETYQSVSEDLQESDDSSNADNANLISQQKIITGMHKGRCVKIFYQIQMIQKVFFAWRNIPSSKNYPIKRRFN